ncbi:type II secretion system F family protein [Jeongeupia sp. HS-3]|uniref:type II secretion system F family protein n=1 Tax=Jeongeupia sp. HS-3 TaxID=1009682 RepID=UPI0019106C1F|nr:type II secretion system F family protein [Jeongeupia sp. HS-3]
MLIAAALSLSAYRRRERQLSSRLARQSPHAYADEPLELRQATRTHWQLWWQTRQAELPPHWRFWLLLPLCLGLAAQLVWQGPAGLAGLVLGIGLLVILQGIRTIKQRQRATRQLPAFLEGLARLASVGQSLPQGFGKLIAETPQPLGAMMQRAQSMHAAGVELDTALHQNAKLYQIAEFDLLATAMRVAVRYGGQPEKLINRIAIVLQTRHASHEELLALTSEVRLSAWVLGGMPITLGIVMGIINHDYMAVLFSDPTGQKMLAGVLIMQVIGAVLLYRLAKQV